MKKPGFIWSLDGSVIKQMAADKCGCGSAATCYSRHEGEWAATFSYKMIHSEN